MSDGWIEFKDSVSPFHHEVYVDLKVTNHLDDSVEYAYKLKSKCIIWNNKVRSDFSQITHYKRSVPIEIGDKVKIVNSTLDTDEAVGRVINLTENDLVHVKLDDDYVVHRNGRATHIVRYKDCNLKLLSKQTEETIGKSPVMAILFGARENSFDKVCMQEYMECVDVEDAREQSAKLIKRNKDCGIKYFWLTLTNLPRQVDIEERDPKLVKL